MGGYPVHQRGEESPVYLPPIGPSLADGVRVLLERSAGQERPLTLVGADATVVERLEDAFPGRFTFTSQRGDFDYIYRTRDLAELPGSAYHAKRNHIAGFSRKFNWTFEPIDGRNTAEVEAMAQEWCRQKGNCKDKACVRRTVPSGKCCGIGRPCPSGAG